MQNPASLRRSGIEKYLLNYDFLPSYAMIQYKKKTYMNRNQIDNELNVDPH